MKVAVTGANGFVGRHVLAALKRRGATCIAMDLHPPAKEREDLASDWVQMDLQQMPDKVFEKLGRPDTCIHLAWGGLPNYKALVHFEKELPGQYRFLSTLVREGLSSLVVSGTCFEYGMQTGALREDTDTRPTNPYGFAKDALRRQLQFLKAQEPFALTWARLFYVYGEGQSAKALWPQLKAAAERGDKAFPMSGGAQLRDYLPIETVAEHLASFALSKADSGVVNVCSGLPVSVRELVEGWIEKMGWSIKPELGRYPYPDYEPMEFWGCVEKLKGAQRS